MAHTDEEVLGTTVQLLAELSTRNNENLRLKAINADLLAALQEIANVASSTRRLEANMAWIEHAARNAVAKATGE